MSVRLAEILPDNVAVETGRMLKSDNRISLAVVNPGDSHHDHYSSSKSLTRFSAPAQALRKPRGSCSASRVAPGRSPDRLLEIVAYVATTGGFTEQLRNLRFLSQRQGFRLDLHHDSRLPYRTAIH